MKLDSKYFDRLRIKPEKDRPASAKLPVCEWPGCSEPAPHKAPKGRLASGEYHNFCLEHVRQYNKSYNYFDGMGDDDVISYQRDALTGHRPTWSVGKRQASAKSTGNDELRDPFGVFSKPTRRKPKRPQKRRIRPLERKSLSKLGLDETADADQIKVQYKLLVKRHHPDANGGSRDAEDRLREIIEAYRHLKSVGICQ